MKQKTCIVLLEKRKRKDRQKIREKWDKEKNKWALVRYKILLKSFGTPL